MLRSGLCANQVKVTELVEGLQLVQAGFFTEVTCPRSAMPCNIAPACCSHATGLRLLSFGPALCNALEWSLSLYQVRHDIQGDDEDKSTQSQGIVSKWRQKERLKTTAVALVLCLNIGVDPPDVIKISPCARLECWVDPLSMQPPKALDTIGTTTPHILSSNAYVLYLTVLICTSCMTALHLHR